MPWPQESNLQPFCFVNQLHHNIKNIILLCAAKCAYFQCTCSVDSLQLHSILLCARRSIHLNGRKSSKLFLSKTCFCLSSCRTWVWTQPTLGSATSPWSRTSSSVSERRWGSRTRWWLWTCRTPPTQSGGPSLPTVPSWILPAKSSPWKVREEGDAWRWSAALLGYCHWLCMNLEGLGLVCVC